MTTQPSTDLRELPVRAELADAFERSWTHTASPGTWWSSAERVAIAQAVRAAWECELCTARKSALSPYAVSGTHRDETGLPPALVDVVHRLTTDQGRLSRRFYDDAVAAGIAPGAYVEALAVVVRTVNIDKFLTVLGLASWPLPAPAGGNASGGGPRDFVDEGAWVPMLPLRHPSYRGAELPNVVRALSAVPDEMSAMMDLAAVQYLDGRQVVDATYDPGRAISRAQIELIAARVSALSECFY